MTAQTVEILALAIAEMNGAFMPGSETFIYRNPGRLKTNTNLRQFTTWAGGLKSLISELVRYDENNVILSVAANYGCESVEKQFIFLDYLSRSFGKTIERDTTMNELEKTENQEN